MKLGLAGDHGTRGHIKQPIGAVQRFFEQYPAHIATVNAASELDPFKPTGQVLADWMTFMGANGGSFGRKEYGYSFNTLKRLLTPKYGGARTGGGGGDNEFETVLRLVAAFL